MNEIVAEITRLDASRRRAMVDRDLETLERLLSDDLVYVHNNAEAEGKRQYIERVKNGIYNYREVTQPELAVRVVGGVALVTGRTLLKVTLPDGTPKTVDGTTVTVWARTDGAWRLEYYQGTPRAQAS